MSDSRPSNDAEARRERLEAEIRAGRYAVDSLDVADAILRRVTMRDLVEAFDQSNDGTVSSSSSD